MNILNILLSNKNGGVEQSFVQYCRALKDLGHNVVALVKEGAPYIKDLEKLNILVLEIKNNFGYYDFFAVRKINQIIKNNSINLVFANAGRAIALAKKAIKGSVLNQTFRRIFYNFNFSKTRVNPGKLTFQKNENHKNFLENFNLRHPLKKPSDKIPLIAVNHSNNVKRSIGADIVLSVNKDIFYKTIDKGQPLGSSFVVPNFIEVPNEVPNDGERKFDLEKFTFGKDKPFVIGAMSRLEKEKGVEYLIRAVKILSDKNYQVKLKIAGSGSSETELKKLCNNLGLNDRVEFVGWTLDKKAFYSNIDIFCLPSLNETFGIVLLEAMLYNKPIIATKTNGAGSILKDGVSGILIKNLNTKLLPNLIADAAVNLLDNPEMVFDFTTNARKDLINQYSMQAVCKSLANIIDSKNKDLQLTPNNLSIDKY